MLVLVSYFFLSTTWADEKDGKMLLAERNVLHGRKSKPLAGLLCGSSQDRLGFGASTLHRLRTKLTTQMATLFSPTSTSPALTTSIPRFDPHLLPIRIPNHHLPSPIQ